MDRGRDARRGYGALRFGRDGCDPRTRERSADERYEGTHDAGLLGGDDSTGNFGSGGVLHTARIPRVENSRGNICWRSGARISSQTRLPSATPGSLLRSSDARLIQFPKRSRAIFVLLLCRGCRAALAAIGASRGEDCALGCRGRFDYRDRSVANLPWGSLSVGCVGGLRGGRGVGGYGEVRE